MGDGMFLKGLHESVENLRKKKVHAVAAKVGCPFESSAPGTDAAAAPNRGNEGPPCLLNSMASSNVPYYMTDSNHQGTGGKQQRPRRHANRGSILVYPVSQILFKAAVHEHTSQRSPARSPEVVSWPVSPNPLSTITSMSGFTSPGSISTTPHSLSSSSITPLSSPHDRNPSDGFLATSRSGFTSPASNSTTPHSMSSSSFTPLSSPHDSNPSDGFHAFQRSPPRLLAVNISERQAKYKLRRTSPPNVNHSTHTPFVHCTNPSQNTSLHHSNSEPPSVWASDLEVLHNGGNGHHCTNPSQNTNLRHCNSEPPSVWTSGLEVPHNGGNGPAGNDAPAQGVHSSKFASLPSLERFLMQD